MKKVLQTYHYSKEHYALIFYLWQSEGYIQFIIPLVMHAGIVYRAVKVEKKGWLDKRFELSVRDAKGHTRVFRLFFRDIKEEHGADIGRFFVAVRMLATMPAGFLPDDVAFSAMPPPPPTQA